MIKRKYKKILKTTLWVIVGLFIILNVEIIIQAYSVTHFNEKAQPIDPEHKPTFGEIVSTVVCGMDVPRPQTRQMPTRSYETIFIPVDKDRKLEAWLFRTDSIKHGIVLGFHGYMDEKSSMLDRTYPLLDMGYDVLLIDFMGAGGSYGNQSTIGFLEAENVKVAHDYVISNLKEDKVILAGFSMGAVAIMKAQADYNLLAHALILEAPYGTFKGTVNARVKQMGIPRWPTTDMLTFWIGCINGFNAFKLNPEDYAKNIYVPTLLMCGGKDPHIPQEETQGIYDRLGTEKKKIEIYPESLHESYLLKYPDEWQLTVLNFLNKLEQLDVYNE